MKTYFTTAAIAAAFLAYSAQGQNYLAEGNGLEASFDFSAFYRELKRIIRSMNGENVCMGDGYCSKTGHYCGDWRGATLRRIPAWGAEVPDSYINFEWPRQEDWAAMTDHGAKLDSLELKTVDHSWPSLGSAKVNLSNGQQSPVMKHKTWDSWTGAETITFDPDVSIRAVDSIRLWEYIASLQFYDGNDSLYYDYDPINASSQYKSDPDYDFYDHNNRRELADNEALIGVYGVTDYYENLITFGYVVKVKPEQPHESVGTCPSNDAYSRIFIRDYIGREPIRLGVKLTNTIADIKAILQKKGLIPSQQTLIFNSEVLEDDRTLSSYKIKNDYIIDLKYVK